MKKTVVKVLILVCILTCSLGINVFASERVTANKWVNTKSGTHMQAEGWVNIIDRETGHDVYHYTRTKLFDMIGTEVADSEREYGYGTVYAETIWIRQTYGSAKVYYGH